MILKKILFIIRIKNSKQRHARVILLMHLDPSNIRMLYEIQARYIVVVPKVVFNTRLLNSKILSHLKRLLLGCITINILPFHSPQEAVTLIELIATRLLPDNQPAIAKRLSMVFIFMQFLVFIYICINY